MYKLDKLEQDISEVEGAIEELEEYDSSKLDGSTIKDTCEYKDLANKFSLLQEHLNDHLETIKSFISDIK